MVALTEWILFCCFVFVTWFVLGPYCGYYTYRFYKKKDHIIINKRHPIIVVIFCTLTIATFYIDSPLHLLTYIISNNPEQYIKTNHMHSKSNVTNFNIFIIASSIICNHITIGIIPWLIALRYWLIYFNIEWTKSTENKTWKIHLNHLDINRDWFLSKKSTFGNPKYCLPRLSIFLIIVIVLSLLFRLSPLNTSPVHTTVAAVFFNICPMAIIFILAFKIRKWNDKFYIVHELKLIALLYILILIIYAIFGAVIPSIFHFTSFNRALSVKILTVIGSAITIYIQTIYTLKNVNADTLVYTHMQSMMRMSSVTSITLQSEHRNVNAVGHPLPDLKRKNTSNYRQLLSVIFSDIEQFELFMKHLSKEWSIELLLAVVEMSHFQNIIKTEYAKIESSENNMKLIAPQIALLQNKQISISFIVYHENIKQIIEMYNIKLTKECEDEVNNINDKMIQFKIRAYALYLKYIVGDELEINISFKQKRKLCQLFTNDPNYFMQKLNINPLELFQLFNDVILEIFKLLRDSYYRFSNHLS